MLVAHPIAETTTRALYPLTEAGDITWTLSQLTEDGRPVVGAVLAHVVDKSTVEMPPPLPLP